MRLIALAALLASLASPAAAQNAIVKFLDAQGRPVNVTPTNPLPTSAAGGGGGTSATAANQATQITAEQAIRDRIGATTAPDAGSTNGLITTGNGTLSAISGKLPSTLGAKAAASSLSVTFATDQAAVGPTRAAATPASTTTSATPGTWTSLIAASTTRLGCAVQNKGLSDVLIATAAPGSATAAASWTVPAGAVWSCASGNVIATNEISISSSAASAPLMYSVQ